MPAGKARAATFTLAMLVATSQPVSAQTSPASATDALLRSHRAFHEFWLREWVFSESSRHPTVDTYIGPLRGRKWNPDGSVTFRYSRSAGLALDSGVLVIQKPVSRENHIACARLDELREKGLGPSRAVQITRDSAVDWIRFHRGTPTLIPSRTTKFNVCPSWYLGPESLPQWDENLSIDGPIVETRRGAVRARRAALIEEYRQILATVPADDLLVGQLILLLTDQGLLEDAQATGNACAAGVSWCLALRGFVYARRGMPRAAELAFDSALSRMPPADRCRWSDIAPLLEGELRQLYERANCAVRDSLNSQIWWLADPAWSVAGNDRRAEHFARRMLVQLRSALQRDERFEWRLEGGGDARAEMILRYGWPSYSHWRGVTEDSVREQRLALQPLVGTAPGLPAAPFVSYEYSPGRVHAFPSMRALWSPFLAATSDWSLVSPPGGDTVLHFELPHTITRNERPEVAHRLWRENSRVEYRWSRYHFPDYMRTTHWWPNEHFFRPQRLQQLPEGQVATLRRKSNNLVALSIGLDDSSQFGTVASFRMIASTGPSEFQLLDEGVAQGDQRLVLSGKSPSTQVVLAVESTPARDTAPLWRTRFGLILPGSLDALERGTVAVSPPVLLVKALTGAVDEAVADSMAAAMKSSTRVKSSDQLVVYWESYGSSSSDSIESSIRLEGQTRENALRRFGIWTGLLGERSNVVRVNWKGVTQHSQMIYDGDHPIIVNAVTLNISQLQSGTYDLQVSVRTAGGTEARAVRSIEIVK